MLSKYLKRLIFATAEGTLNYSKRNPQIPANNFRKVEDLTLSSIGVGTYIGAPDSETDLLVEKAIVEAVVSGGINVIDTAINYRYQKAERSVGKALIELNAQGIPKEQLFVCTKIGYIPEDADKGIPGRKIIEKLKNENKITDQDVVGNVHCMHPEFLSDQLQRSLSNLQLSCVDLLYLHNAFESQLPLVKEDVMYQRLEKAFEWCETQRSNKKFKYYGLATWICFRSPVTEEGIHAEIQKVFETAQKVGGKDNGFKFIQAPLNIMMPELFVQKWQKFNGQDMLALNVCAKLGINVITSSPLLQGQVLNIPLSSSLLRVEPSAAKHLQFIRSIPSSSLKCTLVGMKNIRNVQMNLHTVKSEPLSSEEFYEVLRPPGEQYKNKPFKINLL